MSILALPGPRCGYQIATLAPGIMVTIMPSQGLFRPGASLPIMLLRTDRWVADPHAASLPPGTFPVHSGSASEPPAHSHEVFWTGTLPVH